MLFFQENHDAVSELSVRESHRDFQLVDHARGTLNPDGHHADVPTAHAAGTRGEGSPARRERTRHPHVPVQQMPPYLSKMVIAHVWQPLVLVFLNAVPACE
jgi:hypothetical protein